VGGCGSLLGFTEKFLNENKIEAEILDYSPHREIPMVLNDIKILVLPSKREGVPTILLEALACGVIPVASKIGGIPWVLNTARTGVLLDAPSYRAIYSALELLLILSTEDLNEMSKRGMLFIKKYLSLEKAINRYRILKTMIN
jgi:glycosyltransferase involved in cell wall biosynthesis